MPVGPLPKRHGTLPSIGSPAHMGAMNTANLAQSDMRPWDVVMIGGGPAGLSAALSFGRVRRSVLVVDAGEPRNALAVRVGAHGFLGREGISPLELLRLGREAVPRVSRCCVSGTETQPDALSTPGVHGHCGVWSGR
jgi:threonine dehydrogenase-like Zn-dependent dehydrogenase